MDIFNQLLINGLIAGAIYSLVAVGFSLIYSVCRFIHFAHGAVVACGGYFLYLFFALLGLNFWLSVLLAFFLTGIFGWLANKIFYEPLRQRQAGSVILLIASVALMILIESAILIAFGADVKSIGFIKIAEGWSVGGAIITPLQSIIILITLLLLVLLWLFLKKTKIGKAMRAVADNKEVAEIVGISSKKIYSWAFFIGSLIAGVAGVLVGLEQNLEPTMGTNLIIKGFTGAIVGGMNSVPGAILGSFFLGLIENFGIWFLPSGYKDAIAFVILFIFLLFRHQGIIASKR